MSNCRQGRGTVKQRIRAFRVHTSQRQAERELKKWQFFSVSNNNKKPSKKKNIFHANQNTATVKTNKDTIMTQKSIMQIWAFLLRCCAKALVSS
jgi:beta-xylosidase